jgi:S-adenosylmethionine decarboxylase
MVRYCDEITKVLDMTRAAPPSCHYNKKYGWCTYMPWVESGMHCYGWDHRNPPFFSIDLYTCKAFEPIDAVEFTQKFFGEQLIDIVWKE